MRLNSDWNNVPGGINDGVATSIGLANKGHGRASQPGNGRRAGQHHWRHASLRALAALTAPVEDEAEEAAA